MNFVKKTIDFLIGYLNSERAEKADLRNKKRDQNSE